MNRRIYLLKGYDIMMSIMIILVYFGLMIVSIRELILYPSFVHLSIQIFCLIILNIYFVIIIKNKLLFETFRKEVSHTKR